MKNLIKHNIFGSGILTGILGNPIKLIDSDMLAGKIWTFMCRVYESNMYLYFRVKLKIS